MKIHRIIERAPLRWREKGFATRSNRSKLRTAQRDGLSSSKDERISRLKVEHSFSRKGVGDIQILISPREIFEKPLLSLLVIFEDGHRKRQEFSIVQYIEINFNLRTRRYPAGKTLSNTLRRSRIYLLRLSRSDILETEQSSFPTIFSLLSSLLVQAHACMGCFYVY